MAPELVGQGADHRTRRIGARERFGARGGRPPVGEVARPAAGGTDLGEAVLSGCTACDDTRRMLIRESPIYPAWDVAPRPHELTNLARYRRGRALHQQLYDGQWTMLGSRRGRQLHRLADEVGRLQVPGSLVDCGVWNGGSTILMAAAAPDREVWAFDSFEGLPEPGALDGDESAGCAGECLGSEGKLRAGVGAVRSRRPAARPRRVVRGHARGRRFRGSAESPCSIATATGTSRSGSRSR